MDKPRIDEINRPAPSRALMGFAHRLTMPAVLLALLMLQFALVQLLTGVQFGDAPRNLHWGLLTAENPRFLIDGLDQYERIKGFPPDPTTLGSRGLWANPYSGLHPWWGPLPPLLFAAVWFVTRSYTLLQMVVPLAGAGTVLLTYRMARQWLDSGPALVAAAFLACFPLFREYSTVSYSEAISAFVLIAALLAYLRGRTWLTLLGGVAAALTKMDLLAFYEGVVGICLLYALLRRDRSLSIKHHLIALVGPVILASPWIWYHYLHAGQSGPTKPLSLELFKIIFPMMIELTFYAPWFVALIVLATIAIPVIAGIRTRTLPPLPTLALGSWLGLGLLVTLLYCATPGAGNSPRIFIPALPPLAIFFAAGWPRLNKIWRRRLGALLITLFLTVNAIVIGYQTLAYGIPIRAAMPAWERLRTAERGFVLTPLYWETILYSGQPATWFEADEVFEKNIMQNGANFARYVEANPIHYVLLPDADPKRPIAPEVQVYLAEHARAEDFGAFTLYVLKDEG